MSTTSALLKKLQDLHRQHVELEHQIAAVESQIVAGSAKPAPKTRPKRQTTAEVVEVVKTAVKVLRDAGAPLPRREVAARLGVSQRAASYRLAKAVEMKFAEKVGLGRYRATNVVPVFQ